MQPAFSFLLSLLTAQVFFLKNKNKIILIVLTQKYKLFACLIKNVKILLIINKLGTRTLLKEYRGIHCRQTYVVLKAKLENYNFSVILECRKTFEQWKLQFRQAAWEVHGSSSWYKNGKMLLAGTQNFRCMLKYE